jgi:enoyl-[acyl-carrier protein] reductase III
VEESGGRAEDLELAGRVALVTGSSRGIGRAAVLRLAGRGADIVVHYRRDADAARRVADEVIALGRRAVVARAELTDPDEVTTLAVAAEQHFGRLDLVVANAASSTFRPLLEVREHHVERTFDTIVGSFLALVRAVEPLLRRDDGDPKRIVTVSGFDTLRAIPDHGLLAAAKAALEQLTRYLAVELAPRMTVNSVIPGYVDTASARLYADTSIAGGWAAARDSWAAATPLRRVADADDIARVVAFLCSADAAWLTGQLLVADGGLTLR